MSQTTTSGFLAEVTAFEAAAFRTAQVARRLLAEHPGLPITDMQFSSFVFRSAVSGTPDVSATLGIETRSVDGVRAWATALGVEATMEVSTHTPCERARAEAVIDTVTVEVKGERYLRGAEADAWRTEQARAAAEASAGEAG